MTGYQRFLGLDASANDRSARGRLPMKEEAPAPRDADQPYLALYCILASALTSIPNATAARAWVVENKAAFDALSAASPDRADRLRKIYRLHLDSLAPHAVVAIAPTPAFTAPASDLVDQLMDAADG